MSGPQKTVLSIQSSVVAGHVGNSAAAPAYFAQGIEAMSLPTAVLAHHPGRGPVKGRVSTAEDIAILADGLRQIGALATLDALASGWLGSAANARAVAALVDDVKAARPKALYLCDPVIGDQPNTRNPQGLYVSRELADAIKADLLPRADLIVPNHFEAEFLAGCKMATLPEALAVADALRARGPSMVVITSLRRTDGAATDAGVEARAETLAMDARGAWLCTTPLLGPVPNGSGDLIAALLLARLLRGKSLKKALLFSVAATYGLLRRSREAGAPELLLVGARSELTRPDFTPSIERVR